MNIEKIMVKLPQTVWAILGLVSLGAVIFAGAYWHLFSAGICYVMYESFKAESEEEE